MSLRFIDISNHQSGLDVATVVRNGGLGAVVVKATEGLTFVDKACDGFVQQCLASGVQFGFYHFARNNGATAEADFFRSQTKGYEGRGIPILDWEAGQSVAWVNEFVRRYHDLTGVWPWVYANPWRFRQGTVEPNCGRWVAGYPRDGIADVAYGQQNALPSGYNVGSVCAWQFSSSVRIDGWGGRLDGDVFYGDAAAWARYAGASGAGKAPATEPVEIEAEEGGVYRLYNPGNGDHLFTPDHNEAQVLAGLGWTYEGVAWHVGEGDEVWRLYNPSDGTHMLTSSHAEHDSLLDAGWLCEGDAFRAGDSEDVFRLYNPSNGCHMFTTATSERDGLRSAGWTYEGVAFKVD